MTFMARDLLMPKLGLTMSEGTLLEWKVEPGEPVHKGQVLYVIETDKVATEVEADVSGFLEERLVEEGRTVAVGTPVGRVSPKLRSAMAPAPDRPAETVATLPPSQKPIDGDTRVIATPLARRIARERGFDLKNITGSGPRGRIKAADVEHAAQVQTRPELSSLPPPAETRHAPSTVQAAMARRLAEVKHGTPHFYLATEVEVSALVELRARLNDDAGLPRLTLTHFVLAAVGRSLVDLPAANRVWDDGELVSYPTSDVGMAVETEGGLFVPIVRDPGRKSLDDIAAAARGLIARARSGELSSANMAGGAVSISNAGMHDVAWLTPIINPGQSAIIGVGSIRQTFRPDATGAPALRREMGLVLSGDHRVHTGVQGLTFLNCVKKYLEHPVRLLRLGQQLEA